MNSKKISILFVCLGNICRSPLAEGVFKHLVKEEGLEHVFVVDSCGTGSWHIGNLPDPGSRNVAKENGIDIDDQRSRQIKDEDLGRFDYIVAMDKSNMRDIQALGDTSGELFLLRDYDIFKTSDKNVPDPYGYAGDAFAEVYDIVYRCCENLLEELRKEHEI